MVVTARAGDRLVRLGDADLRGVGTLGFTAHTYEESGGYLSVPLVFERDGERRETSLQADIDARVFKTGSSVLSQRFAS